MKKNEIIPIELLAPAKDADFGVAAINHGADAIYIGASSFGARSAASNSIQEIERLIKYAHLFKVKVYVTLNTILYDNELDEASSLINNLYNTGIDGLIIQDLGLLQMNLPPVPLIASTQTHNVTPEKVKFFENLGFKRVILARELSLSQIKEIRAVSDIELESFIHGAICVSYSGNCYMSQAVCNRSGNRGVCAQPCRSAYDLVDGNNQILIRNKHLLSQKDLNLSGNIKDLIDAGITSFKIEGRLKDITYLKNITSFYRQKIDSVLEEKNLPKSSEGKLYYSFTPEPERSFNRGFTPYFIEGRKGKTGALDSPKSLGKFIGIITSKGENWFTLNAGDLSNADGICFLDKKNNLLGTLVNKCVNGRYFVNDASGIEVGTEIFRNHDQIFEKKLTGNAAERKLKISFNLKEEETGFQLTAIDSNGCSASVSIPAEKQLAQNHEMARKTIVSQLSKLGGTIFECDTVDIETRQAYFIPAGLLNEARRKVVELFMQKLLGNYIPEKVERKELNPCLIASDIDFTYNVSNHKAEEFYKRLGANSIARAFELNNNVSGQTVMTTKYCIKHQLDACPKYCSKSVKIIEPLYLQDNHHVFKLEFDCKKCEMKVIFEK